MFNSAFSFVVAFASVIFVAVVLGLLMSVPVMLLWNYCLVGAVAGIAKIGWLQAWGIMILCAILFKSVASSK